MPKWTALSSKPLNWPNETTGSNNGREAIQNRGAPKATGRKCPVTGEWINGTRTGWQLAMGNGLLSDEGRKQAPAKLLAMFEDLESKPADRSEIDMRSSTLIPTRTNRRVAPLIGGRTQRCIAAPASSGP